jgi:hypothetical protein
MKLYEIKTEYQQALHDLQQIEDVTPQLIEDSLACIQARFEDKALAVAAYIKNLESEVEQMSDYLLKMKGRIDTQENKIERLREYLKHNMVALEIKKIHGVEFDVKVRKANFSVAIDYYDDLGDEWYRKKTVKTIDKEALKAALENGMQINGVRLEQGISLTIK